MRAQLGALSSAVSVPFEEPPRALVAGCAPKPAARRSFLRDFDVEYAGDGSDVLDRIGDLLMSVPPRRFDLVIVDLRTRPRHELDVFLRLRRSDWRPPIVVIVPAGDAELREEAERCEVFATLEWPFAAEALERLVAAARAFGK